MPLANAFLSAEGLDAMEPHYPLRLRVCGRCLLLQLEDYEAPETIFSDYAYFSSYSTTWIEHSRRFAEEAIGRFGLGPESHVVEVGSNDGYLLRWFLERQIPALGIEPAANVAAEAERRGVRTLVRFFGRAVGRELAASARADLIVANNVLAHVPNLDDFVGGFALLLAPEGTLTIEFPHVQRLLEEVQFDTIYHEHFSYFTLLTAEDVLARRDLAVVDVDELPTHGGSLRLYVRHADAAEAPSDRVTALRERERSLGLDDLGRFDELGVRSRELRQRIRRFFVERCGDGERVVGYGAAAKGSTLVNYCGLGPDELAFCVDRNPRKQGTWLPGSRIPVRAPEDLARAEPDVVMILAWNLREEVMEQLAPIREWGGRFAWRSADGVVVA